MATKKLQILNSLVSHETLTNLDAPDQHPIEAVAGLRNELDSKADLVDGKVPVEQLPDDIGGGVETWDELDNKPFGEIGFKIEWDGSPTEPFIDASSTMGAIIYKVGESKTKDELIGATCKYIENGTEKEFTITESSITDSSSENFFIIFDGSAGVFAVTLESGVYDFMGIQFDIPCAGTWFVKSSSYYPIYLASSDYGIKQIDKKYIPSDICTWETISDKPFGETEGSTITWDGNTEGLLSASVEVEENVILTLYKVSDIVLTSEQMIGSNYEVMTDEIISYIVDVIGGETEKGSFYVLNTDLGLPFIFMCVEDGDTIVDTGISFTLPEKGLWFTATTIDGTLVGRTASFNVPSVIKTLDKRFIPSDIGTWEAMLDKPFYETGWSIEWDRTPTTEFIDVSDTMGAILYKVGEAKTKEELIGATCKYILTGNNEQKEFIIEASQITDMDSENCFIIFDGPAGVFGVALEAGTYNFMGISFEFSSTGIYFVDASDYYPIYLGAKEIKQIDKKYISSDIGTWAAMPDKPFGEAGFKMEWNGLSTDAMDSLPINGAGLTLYKVSDSVIPEEDIVGATVGYNQQSSFVVEGSHIAYFDSGNENSYMIMNNSFPYLYNIVEAETITGMGMSLTFPSVGVWFTGVDGGSMYTSSLEKGYLLKQIDKKFIPDDITAAVSLTFDETPTEGSQNPVKSMGIHSAISALEGKITSTFCYKGTVENYTDLPSSGSVVGDVWNIANADEVNGVNAGDNAAWNGTSWDILAGVIDLSDYYTKTEIDSIALNGAINLANYYTKADTYSKSEIDDMFGDCNTIIDSINTLIGGGNV